MSVRGHNGIVAERLLTPSKITAWLDCAHFLTLRHEVDSGAREPAPNMFGEMAQMLLQKGLDHEQAVLEQYRESGRDVFEVSDRTAALRLIGAVLADQHDEWAIARHYLSEASMALLNKTCHTDDAHPIGELIEG